MLTEGYKVKKQYEEPRLIISTLVLSAELASDPVSNGGDDIKYNSDEEGWSSRWY